MICIDWPHRGTCASQVIHATGGAVWMERHGGSALGMDTWRGGVPRSAGGVRGLGLPVFVAPVPRARYRAGLRRLQTPRPGMRNPPRTSHSPSRVGRACPETRPRHTRRAHVRKSFIFHSHARGTKSNFYKMSRNFLILRLLQNKDRNEQLLPKVHPMRYGVWYNIL